MPAELHDNFWRDGFLILQGVFSRDEMADFRSCALAHPPSADLLSEPGLRRLLLDHRVLDIAKELIGPELIYFQDSNVLLDNQDNARFHKDCVDRDDPAGPDWNGQYPIIRFGLYMQEHRGLPGGVDLRRGSHMFNTVDRGEHVYADTELGDLVVWNLRTTHSGCALMLKNSETALDPSTVTARLLRRLPLGLLRAHPERRAAAFMTFGRSGAHLERYIAYLRTRQFAIDGWKASALPPEAVAQANAQGVQIRDMLDELARFPPPYVSVAHKQLPY